MPVDRQMDSLAGTPSHLNVADALLDPEAHIADVLNGAVGDPAHAHARLRRRRTGDDPTERSVAAPLFGTAAASVSHVAPASRVSSILTLSDVPRLCVQAIACGEPTAQATLVFGAVTVTAAGASVKRALLTSFSLAS